MKVPVTVLGEGPLAVWHRRVFARHPDCLLLDQGLPDRTGFVDVCGPPGDGADAIGTAVRSRIPLLLSLPGQHPAAAWQRLGKAVGRNRLPTAALGSLRPFPAAATLKEIVASGVLGNLLSVTLERQGTDCPPGDDQADPGLARWRDADLCLWLTADHPDTRRQRDAADTDGPAERRVHVLGERGELDLRFAAGQTPELTVRFGDRRRSRRIPPLGNEAAHLVELQMAIAARRHGQPWLFLPSLGEVLAALEA